MTPNKLCVCEKVVSGKVVVVCVEGGGGGEGDRECTTKNKNPTQRCGEKKNQIDTIYQVVEKLYACR